MPSVPLPLDPQTIRAHFPAFAEPSLTGWGFFENSGGSYPCAQVLDRLFTYYRRLKVQPYAPFPASTEAGEAMDFAHERMGKLLNVPTEAIHFGPSTSQNTYVLARAFARYLRPGATIVVTNQDHEANSGALRRLAAEAFEIREWRVNPETGHLDPKDLDRLLDSRVGLVAFPHASNIVGEINPAAEICRRIAGAGAISVVDGVSYAPHGPPDVGAIGADVYLISTYKTYGPHQGVMAVKPDLARALPNQGHYFNDKQLRKRLTPAGPDHAQIAASAGIADYYEALAASPGPIPDGADPFRRAHDLMRAEETALLAPLLEFLRTRNDIRLIGPSTPEGRAPTVAIAGNRPGAELAEQLAAHKIMAGGGHFYSVRLLEALGIDPERGVLRLSFVHYTSPVEIERAIEALIKVFKGRP
ncbi:MAG: aminotransferase class V-fold PLP-dependent enzyme [Cucumibacter sp.]